jgi:hypothetical protein
MGQFLRWEGMVRVNLSMVASVMAIGVPTHVVTKISLVSSHPMSFLGEKMAVLDYIRFDLPLPSPHGAPRKLVS